MIWFPGNCFPRIDEILFFCYSFTTFYGLLRMKMSAKRISASNSVQPSIEATSNSLIQISHDTMSKDDLIEAITLRLTRLEELQQENVILKRKLHRYCLNYFLFVTAVFRKPWMCHWVQLNYSVKRKIDREQKFLLLASWESSPHSFPFFYFD